MCDRYTIGIWNNSKYRNKRYGWDGGQNEKHTDKPRRGEKRPKGKLERRNEVKDGKNKWERMREMRGKRVDCAFCRQANL